MNDTTPESPEPRIHLDEPEPATAAVPAAPRAPKRELHNPAEEKVRQDAFDAEYFWNGEPLKPFSSSREALWLQLRAMAGAPSLSYALVDTDAFLADAFRILYLCSHEPEEFRHLRASPIAFQEAIEKWADENLPRERKGEVLLTALRIYNQSLENRHEPAPPEAGGHSDDLGN